MINRLQALALVPLSLMAEPALAQAGNVIMRRPIPLGTSTSSIPTQADPDTVPSTPDKTVCDETTTGTGATGASAAKITNAKWVESGWVDGGTDAQSCSIQKMGYACQATYTCDVGGRRQSFVSIAPDSICEGTGDSVQYPGGIADPSRLQTGRPMSDQVAWFANKAGAIIKANAAAGGISGAMGASEAIKSIPWVRKVDEIKWWTPSEYNDLGGPAGHLRYVRIFIDPGGDNPYDASSEICNQMRAAGHPCSNYYSNEGGSVYVAWILG